MKDLSIGNKVVLLRSHFGLSTGEIVTISAWELPFVRISSAKIPVKDVAVPIQDVRRASKKDFS